MNDRDQWLVWNERTMDEFGDARTSRKYGRICNFEKRRGCFVSRGSD